MAGDGSYSMGMQPSTDAVAYPGGTDIQTEEERMKTGRQHTLATGHASDGTSEEFQRALAGLLGYQCVHFADIENVEETARESKTEVVANYVHKHVQEVGDVIAGRQQPENKEITSTRTNWLRRIANACQ